jgi:plastocyanin
MNLNDALSIKIGTAEAVDVRLGSVSVWSSSLWTFDNPANGSIASLRAEFNGSNTVDWGDGTKYNLSSGATISHTYLSGASAPTYVLTGSSTITESGSANTYTVDTTNVADTTLLYWSINGDTSDFTETSGDITITSDTGTFDITAIADASTEGNEPYTISLHTDSATGLIVNTLSIVVSDTSATPDTPTFSLVNDVEGFAEEGDVVEFTLVTNQTGPFDYTLVGSELGGTPLTVDDFESGTGLTTSLTGTFAGNGSTVRYKLKEDNLTEGMLTMIASITDTNGDGNAEATSIVYIGDTSTAPASPTYDITPRADNVDEGSSLTFDIVTTNVANGTLLHYTILGNTGDFTDIAGNFSIQNNAGVIAITPTADETTESAAETFRVQIRTGGTSGAIVDTSEEVTINDTSQTPAFTPDFELTIGSPSTGLYSVAGTDQNGSVNANNPTLAFNQGDKVTFNNGVSSSHPLYITTSSGSISNLASGVSGAGSAQVDWTIPSAGTYYYQCQVHSSMYGQITVT